MRADPRAEEVHTLLPWYLNGTLDPGERALFESHLATCSSCIREIEVFGPLRDEIARHGEAFLLAHPSPEEIVAESPEGTAGPAGERVRLHLSLCSTCAAEVRLVRSDPRPDRTSLRRDDLLGRGAATAWKAALPWAVASAALVVAFATWWLRPLGPRSEVVGAYYLEPAVRAAGVTVVPAPASGRFQLVLPVEAPSEAYPLAISIRDRSGRIVISHSGIRQVYRDRFLFVLCDRRDFPDGDYLAVVTPSVGSGTQPPVSLEYSFRLGPSD